MIEKFNQKSLAIFFQVEYNLDQCRKRNTSRGKRKDVVEKQRTWKCCKITTLLFLSHSGKIATNTSKRCIFATVVFITHLRPCSTYNIVDGNLIMRQLVPYNEPV